MYDITRICQMLLDPSDVNKDSCKDHDKNKDFTYSYLLQVAAKPTILLSTSSNNNEHKVKVHNI